MIQINDEEFKRNQVLHREKLIDLINWTCTCCSGYSQEAFQALDDIAELSVNVAKNHGFEISFELEEKVLGFNIAFENLICKATALQHSEVSETLEEARKKEIDFHALLTEQADVLYRTINLMNGVIEIGKKYNKIDDNVSIGDIVKGKLAKNIERPFSHGGKRF